MFFCTDVHYDDEAGTALAAAVGFWHSSDAAPSRCVVHPCAEVAPYRSGAFYERELPCLLQLLERVRRREALDLVIVDGHVWLQEGRPGLGHHLWRALGERVPVFGLAKAAFAEGCAVPVRRGGSRRPLWVSAAGVPVDQAVDFVRRMHGAHRLPTLVARADALSRGRSAW